MRQLNARRDVPGDETALLPGCILHNFGTSIQTITTVAAGGIQIVTGMLSRYDPYGWGNAASGTITLDRDATVEILFWGVTERIASEYSFAVLIYVDGNFIAAVQHATVTTGGGAGAGQTGRHVMALSSGQVVTLRVAQNSGANRALDGALLGVLMALEY